MAIQHRRGLKVDFDPNKMLPGEFAYALDTAELFYCYGVGNVKRLATIEDIEILLDTNETAYTALQQLIAELENETVLSGILADVSDLQNNKLDKTGVSSNNTVIFSEASEDEDIVSGETHSTLFGKILKSIKTFRGNISNITTNIGTLASLLTTDRSNLVNAINELHQDHATHLADNISQVLTVIRNSTVTGVQHIETQRKMKSAIAIARINSTPYFSIGFCDQDLVQRNIVNIGSGLGYYTHSNFDSSVICMARTASAYFKGTITNLTDNGFDIVWEKAETLSDDEGEVRAYLHLTYH